MSNISYIKLLQTIESFASAHLQIKKFGSDFPSQMPNFSTTDEAYPILFVSPTNSIFNQNTTTFTLDVYCFDIIQKDRENINTILSDTNSILSDLEKWFRDGDIYGVDIISSSSVNPLNNALLDYAAGWVMTLTLDVNTYGVCEIPFNESPVVVTEVCDIVYAPYLTCASLSDCSTITTIQDDIAALSAATDANTFTTGFTYNDANRLTISDNAGTNLSVDINSMTGLTINGSLSATTYLGLPTGGYLTYMFDSTLSDIATYSAATSINNYVVGALTTKTTNISTTPTLMGVFATPVGGLGITYLPPSIILSHFETQKVSGGQGYVVNYRVFKRTAGGVETLIGKSDDSSSSAANTLIQQTLSCTITTGTTFNTTDRIITKIYGTMLNSTANVDLIYADNTNARIEIPVVVSGPATVWEAGSAGSFSIKAKNDTITNATNDYAVAEGNGTLASGPSSHAEGSFTIASGEASHTEGIETTASGLYSHAGGKRSVASGVNSFVHGSGSTASGSGTIVLGNGISGGTNNTTFVNALNIKTLGSGTSVTSLALDASGNVISGSTGSSSIPQANKIYVDSVNGLNSAGRGDINTPYLTPEYALSSTTNTGTVTATTTNGSATLTSVSSTANIVIGQFITGAGIPYNSVVVSKTVSTIVLSQVCTASATVTATWWTVYELVLNGNFTWVSNWFKQGFIFNFGTSNINFSGVVFTSTAAAVVPWVVKGGNWNGTNTTSKILSISQSSVASFLFEPISFISVGTSYSIDCNQNGSSKFGQLTINCDRYRCLFGWVGDFESTGIVNLNGNFYGLLGVVRVRYPRLNTTGTLECPSAVYAILDTTSGYGIYNVNSDIRGSVDTKQSYGTINGRIVGTTVTTEMYDSNGTAFIFNGPIACTTINVNGYAKFNGMTRGNVVHTREDLYLTEHMGNITGSGTDTTCTVWGSSGAGFTLGTIALTGTYTLDIMNSRYMINGLTSLNIGSGCTVNNYGYYRGTVSSCAGTLNNTGRMLLNYKVTCTGTIRNNNFISIDNTGGENSTNTPCIALGGTGKYIQNGGQLYILRADSLSGAIRKTGTGQNIQLLNQAYIRVTNGLAPIQIISNSGTAQDVEVYSVINNCAVGFRMADTFTNTTYGTAYAPNILKGGIMMEDTTNII